MVDDTDYFLVLGIAILWLVPALVAGLRRHRSRLAIVVMTVLLGWMPIFWIWALVWACTGNVEQQDRARFREREERGR